MPSRKTYKIRAPGNPEKPLQKRMGAFLKTFWNKIDITYALQFLRSLERILGEPLKKHTKYGIQNKGPGTRDNSFNFTRKIHFL